MTPDILDANVFITARRNHYRFAVCPGFWDWLIRANAAGQVYSIDRVLVELNKMSDELATWANNLSASFFLPTDSALAPALRQLSTWATGRQYSDSATRTFFASADYWLIAFAMTKGWRLVTHEIPAPDAIKSIKIPDACNAMGVQWIDPFEMLEELGAQFTLTV